MARLLEEQGRFRSRQQTKDSHVHTLLIVQPKASRYIAPQNQTPTALSVAGTHIVSATDRAVPANVYNGGNAVPSCCSAVAYNGNSNFAGADGIAQQRQACAVCPTDNYWLFNGYSIDMSGQYVKGGVCCPVPNLPNTAQQTSWEKCSNCLKFYFPRHFRCCYGTPYPSSQLYPRLPPDMDLERYGDNRLPEQPCNYPQIANLTVIPPVAGYTNGPWSLGWQETNNALTWSVQATVYDENGTAVNASFSDIQPFTLVIGSLTAAARNATYTVTVVLTNQCGTSQATASFLVSA